MYSGPMDMTSDSAPEPSAIPRPPRQAYLDGIPGYEPVETWGLEDPAKVPERLRTWKAQQARYGFDSRSTWSLDTAVLELTYERLRMYRDIASSKISMDFHYFGWAGGRITQGQALDLLIGFAETALSAEVEELESAAATGKFWDLWAIVHRVMWW